MDTVFYSNADSQLLHSSKHCKNAAVVGSYEIVPKDERELCQYCFTSAVAGQPQMSPHEMLTKLAEALQELSRICGGQVRPSAVQIVMRAFATRHAPDLPLARNALGAPLCLETACTRLFLRWEK